jgi:hypothetical protein
VAVGVSPSSSSRRSTFMGPSVRDSHPTAGFESRRAVPCDSTRHHRRAVALTGGTRLGLRDRTFVRLTAAWAAPVLPYAAALINRDRFTTLRSRSWRRSRQGRLSGKPATPVGGANMGFGGGAVEVEKDFEDQLAIAARGTSSYWPEAGDRQ